MTEAELREWLADQLHGRDYNWLRVVFEKMDIQSTHESASSGWYVFETNANRFALSSQVHGTKPIDNLLQQTSIRQR